MAVFKCKMCGAALKLQGDEKIIECEFCGTQQTLPRLTDETRENLYDRANHFRRNNDYDKAMSIYEQILNEEKTDAEAYWSIVLCRYGIEYVEDPATKKRVPTINRAQFASVLADEDYKSALQYADSAQKKLYEAEAKAIDKIQKGILAISQAEEPFDVFICYKETDNNGRRTPDSVLAQELYYGLKDEGFKVFFARITLEDKLGSAYEPYIFAALNSSKAMVVLGTRPEHFKAVWVKNEWSRYLSLIKNGAKKTLIPAYKGMDPYDLPDEFSHLQAQDMSKLGFMQDLIRGIKKIVNASKKKETPQVVVQQAAPTGNVSILLTRMQMSIEDGEFDQANKFAEQILNQDPTNAQAYLGKLMAEFTVKSKDKLGQFGDVLDKSTNYARLLRFGDKALIEELKGYVEEYKEKQRQKELEEKYQDACRLMRKYEYEAAAYRFAAISNYKDSALLKEECLAKDKEYQRQLVYKKAQKEAQSYKIDEVEGAIKAFSKMPDYLDSLLLKEQSEKRLAELKKRKKRKKRIIISVSSTIGAIVTCWIIFFLIFAIFINPSIQAEREAKEEKAYVLVEQGKYSEAYEILVELDIEHENLGLACSAMMRGNFREACKNYGLTKIVIPDGVTSIRNEEFYNCYRLTKIVIPDSVTSIGDYAFKYCYNLTSVVIGDSVTSIGDYAFWGCSSLTEIVIPSSVTSIGAKVFNNCDNLTIYCEAASRPSGWDVYWNVTGWSDLHSVVWGYKGE